MSMAMRPRRPRVRPCPNRDHAQRQRRLAAVEERRRGGSGAASAPVERAGDALDRHITPPNRASVPTASMCTTLVASAGRGSACRSARGRSARRRRHRARPAACVSPRNRLGLPLHARALRRRRAAVCTSRMRSGDGLGCALDPRVRPRKTACASCSHATAKRHGTPRPYQGQEDIPLSPTGEAQARSLGERLCGRASTAPWPRRWRAPPPRNWRWAKRARRCSPFDRGLIKSRTAREGLLASGSANATASALRAWRRRPRPCRCPAANRCRRCWSAHGRRSDAPRPGWRGRHAAGRRPRCGERVLLCRLLGIPLSRLWNRAPATLNLLEGADVDRLDVVRLNLPAPPRCSAKRCTAL